MKNRMRDPKGRVLSRRKGFFKASTRKLQPVPNTLRRPGLRREGGMGETGASGGAKRKTKGWNARSASRETKFERERNKQRKAREAS